jgi:hypothetical protein
MALGCRQLVARLGPHLCTRAGLDPTSDADTAGWLALAILLSARIEEERALAIWRALAATGLRGVADVAGTEIATVATLLAREHVHRPASVAGCLVRACRELREHWGGSFTRLAASSDDLFALGSALSALAPGLGHVTVLRLMRPLRDGFAAARETPLAASAHAAAVHLGWLAEGDDAEGEPASLRAHVARESDAPPFADVEAALERLGNVACLRARATRCPLGTECPLRATPTL